MIGSPVYQGCSVALSSDGNTLVYGGFQDDNNVGAAWVWKNISGTWTEIAKLTANNPTSTIYINQGSAVDISSDGSVIAVLGPKDGPTNGVIGAIWIYKLINGTYTQIQKLTSSDGNGELSGSVSINGFYINSGMSMSSDGNIIVAGNPAYSPTNDENIVGGVDIFINTNGIYTQQGDIVIGSPYMSTTVITTGFGLQGSTVRLSADGNTLVFGSLYSPLGLPYPTFVFTKSQNTWKQQSIFTYNNTGSRFSLNTGIALSSLGDVLVVGQTNISTGNPSLLFLYT